MFHGTSYAYDSAYRDLLQDIFIFIMSIHCRYCFLFSICLLRWVYNSKSSWIRCCMFRLFAKLCIHLQTISLKAGGNAVRSFRTTNTKDLNNSCAYPKTNDLLLVQSKQLNFIPTNKSQLLLFKIRKCLKPLFTLLHRNNRSWPITIVELQEISCKIPDVVSYR